jgi:hypothetical protein
MNAPLLSIAVARICSAPGNAQQHDVPLMKTNAMIKQTICLAWLGAFWAGTALPAAVANLRCEYLANPNGIDVFQPRLSFSKWPRTAQKRS